jgi:hypothetical protein
VGTLEGAKARLSKWAASSAFELSILGSSQSRLLSASTTASSQPVYPHLSPLTVEIRQLAPKRITDGREKMLPNGRGAVAHIEYTGEEAAPEIRKLLGAVVGQAQYSLAMRADGTQVENEDEFDRWEALVTRASELEGGVTRNSSPSAIELVRNVYDCFLQKFPLFFGYWKKYADLEFAIGGTETAEMVYERGVCAVTTSVDLWANYCTFKMDTCHDNDIIRE